MMPRYYVRWRTKVEDGRIVLVGFSVCDNQRKQMLEVADFGTDELDHASAICRMLNIQEDIDYDSSCREG